MKIKLKMFLFLGFVKKSSKVNKINFQSEHSSVKIAHKTCHYAPKRMCHAKHKTF